MKEPIKIASAPTVERLEALLNKYWCTTTIKINGAEVHNSKGVIPGVEVITKKGRYIAQSKP